MGTGMTNTPCVHVGGTFEDETGWWQLDEITTDGGWFHDRWGTGRLIAWDDVPELFYL